MSCEFLYILVIRDIVEHYTWSEVKLLSCVWLFVIPWSVVHWAPLSMGFSRQGYWNGLPFLPPGDLPEPGINPLSPGLLSLLHCKWIHYHWALGVSAWWWALFPRKEILVVPLTYALTKHFFLCYLIWIFLEGEIWDFNFPLLPCHGCQSLLLV